MKLTRSKQFVDQKFVRTGWVQQKLQDCRFAAVEMYDTSVRDCQYLDCKFSSVNWRNSKFKQVEFRNCIFDKVDLSGCEFLSCSFIDCDWQNIILSGSKVGVKKLVLTGSKFGDVAGLDALAGQVLSYEQAIALLPLFLQDNDIEIADQ